MNVPEVCLIITDSLRSNLRENVDPLQESANYEIGMLNNLLSVLQNFKSCIIICFSLSYFGVYGTTMW